MTKRHPKNELIGNVVDPASRVTVDVYLAKSNKRFYAYFPDQEAKDPVIWVGDTFAEVEKDVETFLAELRDVEWTPMIEIELDMPFSVFAYSEERARPFAGFRHTRYWIGKYTNPTLLAQGVKLRQPYLDTDPEELLRREFNMLGVWMYAGFEKCLRGFALPYSDALWDGLNRASDKLKEIHAFLAHMQMLSKSEEGQAKIIAAFTGGLLTDSQMGKSGEAQEKGIEKEHEEVQPCSG